MGSSAPPFLWRLFVAVYEADMARIAIVSGQDICGNLMNVTTGGGSAGGEGDAAPHPAASHHNYLKGILLVMVGTTITSLAGVYTEWVLKRHKSVNFFKQNSLSGATRCCATSSHLDSSTPRRDSAATPRRRRSLRTGTRTRG